MLLNSNTVVYYEAKNKDILVVHEHNIVQPMRKLQVFNFILTFISHFTIQLKTLSRCGSHPHWFVGQQV